MGKEKEGERNMSGPCLCGDPYCPSCGSPEAAKVEAANEWAMAEFSNANLTPDEYKLVVKVGLQAVEAVRKAVDEEVRGMLADREADAAYTREMMDPDQYQEHPEDVTF
jgi:hypothetical protein